MDIEPEKQSAWMQAFDACESTAESIHMCAAEIARQFPVTVRENITGSNRYHTGQLVIQESDNGGIRIFIDSEKGMSKQDMDFEERSDYEKSLFVIKRLEGRLESAGIHLQDEANDAAQPTADDAEKSALSVQQPTTASKRTPSTRWSGIARMFRLGGAHDQDTHASPQPVTPVLPAPSQAHSHTAELQLDADGLRELAVCLDRFARHTSTEPDMGADTPNVQAARPTR